MPATENSPNAFDWRQAAKTVELGAGSPEARPFKFAYPCAAPSIADAGTAAAQVGLILMPLSMGGAADRRCDVTFLQSEWEWVPELTVPLQFVVSFNESHAGAPFSGQQLALDLRERSQLTDAEIGELFPVTRETFNRWRTGTLTIGRENLARLRSIHSLVLEADNRTSSLRDWLLSADVAGNDETSPLELLKTHQYTRLWNLVTGLPVDANFAHQRHALAFDHAPDHYEPDLSDWDEDD